ncbi:MAG: phosphate ABC transporter permease subunit PstC [Dehalococcoidia bacterium]|nr:phosphate ABC transporter permease subunit PstC [Dehalococcoidia bacterium]
MTILREGMKNVSATKPRSRFRGENLPDVIFRLAALIFASLIVLLLLAMVGSMVKSSWPAIQKFGTGFLVGSTWDPVFQNFGALPFIYGTVVSSLLALLLAVPVSLGAAIFLAELAPPWVKGPVSMMIELLAAIPSVVYGLWGIFVLNPWLRTSVEPMLGQKFGFLPLFQGPIYGLGMLSGGLILAIMIIPTISSISREVLTAVPNSQREAMYALGATRWETITRVIVPYARAGIVGAIVLGLGRAVGETMAVTMVIGNRPEISASLFAPGYTMASVIANEFAEATYDLYLSALVEMGLVLLFVTVILNGLARLLVWRVAGSLPGAQRE